MSDLPVCDPRRRVIGEIRDESILCESNSDEEKIVIARDYLLYKKRMIGDILSKISHEWSNDQYITSILSSLSYINKLIQDLDNNTMSYPAFKQIESFAHVHFCEEMFLK